MAAGSWVSTTPGGHVDGSSGYGQRLVRIAREAMEFPVLRQIARPLYRRYFRRPYPHGNLYYGIFPSYAQALAQAAGFASPQLPSHYDVDAAGRLYRSQLQQVRICDYAAMFWLDRMLAAGVRRVFDLGGHIGQAYYGFGRYLRFPEDLDWCVHDVPKVMASGRQWASAHDAGKRLRFDSDALDADGTDLLISSGALQYLDYTLPELLAKLGNPPAHVIFNLTPMHPQAGFFTLQNLGIAICPYRVIGIPEMTERMADLGYRIRDRWELPERALRIPFHPDYTIDRYYGFYFQRSV
ncbi:putative methyltransferase, LIC12133 family [Pseudoxanthomonas wuyuanensis]|uniref:Putative methyltransferase, LIC12133 family n=1 Tax=Pseudoxanthomonas wuyuanensis TaxID=1073196 RepID=A0A286D3F8_9GAMM|nr:methyltransferase, TIGR04325 family [Pseudoxanthomonas wuyuanensis]SOD53208.1 putative methyltransferase, LIC12133 family [Pseudoxanthomonas wuyuanensis]